MPVMAEPDDQPSAERLVGVEDVEAEFINVNDFLGGVELLLEAVQAAGPKETAVPPVYARVRMRPEAEAQRLEQTRNVG